MYHIYIMSNIAKLIAKKNSGAIHSHFIHRISESLRNARFNPYELELLWEFKYASMLFYRASQEWNSEKGYPLTLIYIIMWIENFRLIQLLRKEKQMNGDTVLCLGKSKKHFIAILTNEFKISTKDTNFPPLTIETYKKILSLVNGKTPYGERLFNLDDFYHDKKYIYNNCINIPLKSIIWVNEMAVIKNTFTPSTAGRLTGYSQRFNFIQENKWKLLGLDTSDNNNFLRDLVYFKSGLMPQQKKKMEEIVEHARIYLKKYIGTENDDEEILLERKDENKIIQRCYGVRQKISNNNK